MHIPDGFVSDHINMVMAGAAVAALAVSADGYRRRSRQVERPAGLFAAVCAFIFAAQMLNFPIGGGTSGHFLGAVFAAAFLGPWGACLALSCVLVVQGLFFGDGGLAALGTNIVNMGVVGGLLGGALLRFMQARLPQNAAGRLIAVGVTSWASVVAASSLCAVELALSETSPLAVALPAMAGTHALIGVGEAAIAVAAVALASKVRDVSRLSLSGAVVAVLLSAFVSPFASSLPDGLEQVAQSLGFMSAAAPEAVVWTMSPFADYQVPALATESLSTGVAGAIGSLLVLALAFGAGRWTQVRRGV